MVNVDVPFVVCVSPDRSVRERVVRRLDGCAVLMCADLDELRVILPEVLTSARPPTVPPSPADPPPPVEEDVIRVGDLALDGAGHVITWRDDPLPLSRLERRMLARLAAPPLTVWTYQQLFHSVWGGAYLGDTAILHSTVKRLRRKLQAVESTLTVKTIRGVGYRLAVPERPTHAEPSGRPGTMAG